MFGTLWGAPGAAWRPRSLSSSMWSSSDTRTDALSYSCQALFAAGRQVAPGVVACCVKAGVPVPAKAWQAWHPRQREGICTPAAW